MKKILIIVAVLLILTIGGFVWNTSQTEIKIDTPVSNQGIGIEFTLSGEIPSMLLKDSAFGIDLLDKNGKSITGQLVEVSAPWWSRFISIPIHFNQKVDTSGMTAETSTCFGAATLVVSSLKDAKLSRSIPVNCTAK